jgi:hypothetical protein
MDDDVIMAHAPAPMRIVHAKYPSARGATCE